MRLFFLLFAVLFSFTTLTAQQQDTTAVQKDKKERSYNLAAYPVLFYLPETRLGFGAAGITTFRFKGESESSRPSQVRLIAAYTLNKQILFYLPYELYWQEENWLARGEVGYYRYFYDFYGIGNDQPTDYKEQFEVRFPRVRFNLQRLVAPNLYTGVRYWFDNYNVTSVEEGGQLASDAITGGGNGGIVSGLGWLSAYDSRDNIFYPTKGFFIETLAFFNKKALGSDFNFNRYTLDAVSYIGLPWKDHVIATNLYTGFITGDAPFNELMLVGGWRRARGYYEGRYRDNSMALVQAEYRFPLPWRFGAVVFGSLGQVADNYAELPSAPMRWNVGGGIRFMLNEEDRVNIRLDVGVGKETLGYYLTIGEAF
ncbi:MAG: BamA/TamA family outer membrane protein [Bacteroidota bacterium]